MEEVEVKIDTVKTVDVGVASSVTVVVVVVWVVDTVSIVVDEQDRTSASTSTASLARGLLVGSLLADKPLGPYTLWIGVKSLLRSTV